MSSTGMLATWWTSPEVVPVLDDVTHQGTLQNKETGQKGSRQMRKRCCIAANVADPSTLMCEWNGIASLRCPAKTATLLCQLLPKTEYGLWLSFSFCSLFSPLPLLFPFSSLADQHTVQYKTPSSTVAHRKRHTLICLKIFLLPFVCMHLVSFHDNEELRIY